MLILGLSGMFSGEDQDMAPDMSEGFFHDAAACLTQDGTLLAAVEEERLNRIKKTTKFPVNAIRACLETAGVSPRQVDVIGYYFAEDAVDQALRAIYLRKPELVPHSSRELISDRMQEDFGIGLPTDRILYAQHHVAHAMSSFIRSGMPEALVVVIDGRGENHSTTVYHGRQGELTTLATYGINKSLGKFYREGTRLLGYGFGDEYKVMGLAPYGNPDSFASFFDSMCELKDDGDFELRWHNDMITSNAFRPRRKGQEFTQQHKDFAAGLQHALERAAMHLLDYWADQTGLRNLCFVGGVAHNSTLNGLILRSGKFHEVFVHPASHDAGAAEGAALAAAFQLGSPPPVQPRMRSASVGPSLGTAAEVEKKLAAWGELVEYKQPADIIEAAAGLLADGAVLGWAHGPSEFGPRALGNRSILADARPSENKDRINSMVKKRESYRPFAPVVTSEAAETYFEIPETRANYDFMSFVVNVRESWRSALGAVTHVDGSARVQVVDADSNARFHRLVHRFGELTGTPVLLNTSFNNNAEPIVQSTEDAITCFLTTSLDYLVIEDFLVWRRAEPSITLGSLIPQFRPVTRLAKQIKMARADTRTVSHEIFLEHPSGRHAEISPAVFSLLEAVDGTRTLESLAAGVGGLTDDITDELFDLWQQRFFALRPVIAD